jgi:hypothetical protein
MRRVLRDLTWDHPRSFDPLAPRASPSLPPHIPTTSSSGRAEAYATLGPNRSRLLPSGSTSSSSTTRSTDAPRRPAVFSIFGRSSGGVLAMLERKSVGPSTWSYEYGGVWGMPTNAAGRWRAVARTLLTALNFGGPRRSFAEVIDLGKGGAQGRQMAWAAWRSERRGLPSRLPPI